MGTYVPNTEKEQKEMLELLGVTGMEELFGAIPGEVLLDRPLKLKDGISEMQVKNMMAGMAGKNKVFSSLFRGCGAYRHYIPAIVKQVTAKEEFMTAYTPYQAEISQGTLQAIFEFQTMISELTGLRAANASVYDGCTAAAEAVIMCREKKRNKMLLSGAMNPQIIETVKTYMAGTGTEIRVVPVADGVTDKTELKRLLDEKTACFLVQQPNYYGLLEDYEDLGKLTKEAGAKYVMSCNPVLLGILKTPGEYGADIAVGEGQPLGLPLAYGGPYLGFMTADASLMRKLPGRIVGETLDGRGEKAYVLTLQAREQHIRREKASSSICSNEALCALTASVYLSAMGKEGLRQAATLSMSKAHYLAERLCGIEGFSMAYEGDYVNEFTVVYNGNSGKLMQGLESYGILGGLPLKGKDYGKIIWCATEMNSREEIDELIDRIKEVLSREVDI
ncbi:aminomethyl-transferring glycine dehydrogenase subunit GcvPA [Anaerocolumna xylanovorans]|uniref:Probable glycine dehydrogenase (decarboxylating) subunit 1 n=1 Tax=Anaerocolumna xylanovorans DSM 12503 TaxID=1121345 RepID=A0A1M7Y088_9FIRM|nr:aminomethyl-transferring glycine dehydrogenase subunit GcvPA [Anaerocolumna xylanovorans]SHO44915.1 glycine dehydrogenase subunit 1 [Anaerocolumna xylanovorans DSM 12503]